MMQRHTVVIHITKSEWEQISNEQQERIIQKLKKEGIELEIK